MAEQAPYLDLNEKIRSIAARLPQSPLAGIKLDVAHHRLDVYWAGAVPDELSALRLTAADRNISVVVNPAAFSERQLMAASNRLAAVAEKNRLRLMVDLSTDGSGLTARYEGLRTAALRRSSATPAQNLLLDTIAEIRSTMGVPTVLEDAGASPTGTSMWADRTNDRAPYWGGSVTAAAGGQCTDSFSMYATAAPAKFMLTAAHCTGFTDGVPVANGVNQRMGDSDFIHEIFDSEPRYDLGVIRLDVADNQGRVYRNPTTVGGLFVQGMSNGIPANGNYCVSGAVGTPNCNLLSGTQALYCDQPRLRIPFGRCIYFIRFGSTTGGATVCHGDSGGPVYYYTNNPTNIIAAGVVSAGDPAFNEPGPCFARTLMSVVISATSKVSGLAVVTWP